MKSNKIVSGMTTLGYAETNTNKKGENESPKYRVLQDRVIELTYDQFDMEKGAEYLNKYDLKMGGCSAVRLNLDGKVYVGRNYDFYCGDSPAFVVRNNSGKIRTIGIGNSPDSFGSWTKDYIVNEKVLSAAPFLCCDVMSEAGLYCETNIRPYEKDLSCQSTNPGAPRRCTQTFMQTMLSQYGTIDEVLEHLNDYDWFDLSKLGFEQSFFLTDQQGRSVIIEFGANGVHWQNADYNANFFINKELYEKETLGCGELRLARELAYRPMVRSENDIFTMMEKGAYTQFYSKDVDVDFAIPEFYEMIGYNKVSAAKDPEGARAAAAKKIEEISSWSWQERIDNHAWESTFITAANVTEKYMHVHFSEHYNIDFSVGFNLI